MIEELILSKNDTRTGIQVASNGYQKYEAKPFLDKSNAFEALNLD